MNNPRLKLLLAWLSCVVVANIFGCEHVDVPGSPDSSSHPPIVSPFELTYTHFEGGDVFTQNAAVGFECRLLNDTMSLYMMYSDTTRLTNRRYDFIRFWFPRVEWYDSVLALFKVNDIRSFPDRIWPMSGCFWPFRAVTISYRDTTWKYA